MQIFNKKTLFLHFNPRSHEGSDEARKRPSTALHHFNPRSHEGSDALDIQLRVSSSVISIHAPTRGATSSHTQLNSDRVNFNPRSHEGSDALLSLYHRHPVISIHAPTRGATTIPMLLRLLWIISIHAPTRGATIESCITVLSITFQSTLPRGERHHNNHHGSALLQFQSTLPRGERPEEVYWNSKISDISIHAPTRGATLQRLYHCRFYIFQSTLPRGERPFGQALSLILCNFNPRSHEGSDNAFFSPASAVVISIHAPTRGATAIFAKKFSFLSAKIV